MARVNKTDRKLSEETKKKISEARRARKKQPRSGQSKKRQSFYQELANDYKGNPEALKWLKENKSKMDGSGYEFERDENGNVLLDDDNRPISVDNPGDKQAKEFGVMTEYSNMYVSFYQFSLASVLFGKKVGDEEESGDFDSENSDDEDNEASIDALEALVGVGNNTEDEDE